MPVTELALLHLRSDPSPSTKSTLLQAQKQQTEYSGYQVTYLRQIQTPASFYLLGGWESIEKHTGEGEWISSETNQTLLAQLKDSIDVAWMFHLDLDPSTLTIPDGPILAIFRYFILPGKKDEFEAIFKTGLARLERDTAPALFSVCGAWRIDKAQEDEFVVFGRCSRDEDEDYWDLLEMTIFGGIGDVVGLTTGRDVRYVRVEKWE
ncbi:uncharacterized protein N7515_005515 [Penicillium bovifimosum]|uniref:Uncharacterized protein n=1 Tax=Penicillium bovifimosum TaxID=126998 RepID=A0A9W9GU75_9EURO|nr:uncharacterized protein N7515_005515 [Penicillium bovifimosum]KAJ5129476.1 hypothetical protein N7515_005515 [Penicillium bovifimosum]